MLLSTWSLGLVGLGLIAAQQGAPSSGTGGSETPAKAALATDSRLDELPGGMRLLWATPDDSGQFAACVGLVVGVATTDRLKREASLVELELRRENLAKAYREKFGTEPGVSRLLDVLSGDIASLCVSVPKSEWEPALSIVLQALRPVIVTPQKCKDIRDNWRNHEGLGALLNEDPVQGQLQELTWLGFPQAAISIPRAIEQSLFLPDSSLLQTTSSKPSRVALTIAGDYSQQAAEKYVKEHTLVRDQLRGQKGHSPWLTEIVARPSHLFSRFARVRSVARKVPVVLFSWPVSQLDDTHVFGLNTLATLLERRLNHGSGSSADGIANCRLIVRRGFGSFVIEIPTAPMIEIDIPEKRVFLAIDQLRTSSIDAVELRQVIELVTSPDMESTQSAIERAWRSAQRAYNFAGPRWASHAQIWGANELNLRRLVETDLPRNNLAEMYVEAAAPRQLPVSRHVKNQSAGSSRLKSPNPVATGRNGRPPMNRQGGRIYSVQKGESLQMIAHKYHVTTAEIIHANGIQHPDQIRPGTVIVIPVSSPSAAPPK